MAATRTLLPLGGSPRLWVVAALFAGSLHLGVAGVAAWSLRAEDADDDDGAPAIELAMDMAAPKTEQNDLPPGPEADASAAAPESAQSAAKAEQSDRPRQEPVESDNPDRIVSPKETKTPEREPEPQVRQSEASTASIASEATAAPQQEVARETSAARAPVLGDGRQALKIRADWQKRLFAHLSRHKKYPAAVAARQAENRVVFTLDRLGHVVSARISKTSGDAAFDNAALDMMKRSDPVPPPPPLVADETLTFEIPVQFRATSARPR
ncbi:MAG TPA: TonB family protein [Rhodoblastus sp.]|nr:TonB family protein [Rhodoblastus sp.]